VPARLRPTAPVAADAILVGDPGRALLLAQELLEQPKMSNHARGLWGYSGRTSGGDELTIQSTGMGGPSAALVLADLAELGVRRAVRVGTCTALGAEARNGELLLVTDAIAAPGSAAAFGVAAGAAVQPDPTLLERLGKELGDEARAARVVSLDALAAGAAEAPAGIAAADMQTVAVLARGRELGIAAAAILIVADVLGSEGLEGEALKDPRLEEERRGDERLDDERLGAAAKRAGRATLAVLSA
jgi:uridine phosphorylase